jgi:outer membrane protein OmpA-like peptidoglycan-associated protein
MLEDSRLEASHVYSDYDLLLSLGGSWVKSPLDVQLNPNSNKLSTAIDQMTAVHFGAGYYLHPWLMFGLTGSYNWFSYDQRDINGNSVKSGSTSGFSDIELKTKIRLMRNDRSAFSLMPFLSLPSNAGKFDPDSGTNFSNEPFLSDKQVGGGMKVLYEYLFSWAQLVANIGYRHNSGAKYPGYNQTDSLITGLGAYFPFHRKIGMNLEFFRAWELPFSDKFNPNEFYLGASAGMTRHLHAFAGFGFGNVLQNNRANAWRVSAGVKYVPKFGEKEEHPIVEVSKDDAQRYVVREGEAPKPIETAAPAAPDAGPAVTYAVAPKSEHCEKAFLFGQTNTSVIRFNPAAYTLDKETEANLDKVIQVIHSRIDDVKQIQVTGYASRKGSKALNLEISKQRALVIAKRFKKAGINKVLKFDYKGSSNLLDKSKTEQAEELNRRVEFKVTMKDKFKDCY